MAKKEDTEEETITSTRAALEAAFDEATEEEEVEEEEVSLTERTDPKKTMIQNLRKKSPLMMKVAKNLERKRLRGLVQRETRGTPEEPR